MVNLSVFVDISSPAQSLIARKYFTELFEELIGLKLSVIFSVILEVSLLGYEDHLLLAMKIIYC